MRIPRIYVSELNPDGSIFNLPEEAANHVGRVLRMETGRELILFNGQSNQGKYGEFDAVITEVGKRHVAVKINGFRAVANESPLVIELGQGISKGDRMDYTIQKAVELGVTSITPLWTERCDVKLKGERLEKKLAHWQQVAISACEQSGRCRVPNIAEPRELNEWLATCQGELKWALDPRGPQQTLPQKISSCDLLVGPEGGLNEQEIALALQQGFNAKVLGPRILRTETAALAAMSMLQSLYGDY
jgi:16S rRNA (uracil1498-N3)-methyltransferase